MKRSGVKGIGAFLLLLMLSCFMVQCGGGTAGTGGQRFSGRIATKAGAPVAHANVTIRQTGDSSITDSGGNFSIETEDDLDACQIDISGAGVTGTVNVASIPDEAETIDMDVSFDESSGDYALDDIDFEDEDGEVVEDDGSSEDDAGSNDDTDNGDDTSNDADDDGTDSDESSDDSTDDGFGQDDVGDDGNLIGSDDSTDGGQGGDDSAGDNGDGSETDTADD